MAMGIVSDEEMNKEIESFSRLPEKREFPEPVARVEERKERGWNGGRKEGDTDIPDVLKRVIGDTILESGNRKHVSSVFGVSESTVSAAKVGAHSTASYHRPDKDLNSYIQGKKREIADRARGTLDRALDNITDEKLAAAKVRDLAGIAKDMAAVVRDMESGSEEKASQTNIVFYSPKPKTEEDYTVIQVTE